MLASGWSGGLAIRPTAVRRRLTHSVGSVGALNPYERSCSAWNRSRSCDTLAASNRPGVGIVSS